MLADHEQNILSPYHINLHSVIRHLPTLKSGEFTFGHLNIFTVQKDLKVLHDKEGNGWRWGGGIIKELKQNQRS